MFNIGDLIVYSSHGICHVDDICEMTYLGVAKDYYVLHPIENANLKINIPVDNDKVIMLELLNREEAEKIIESFNHPGVEWIEQCNDRIKIYSDIVKTGNRKDIARVANTLIREKIKAEKIEKKLYEKDSKLLTEIQNILFAELAVSLNTTFEKIDEKINRLIKESNNYFI